MNSIIQTNKECWFCGTQRELQKHHCVFGVPGRKNSEKYGLTVWLCREHHTGNSGVHQNRELDLELKRVAQKKFEEEHSRNEWMAVFGRNYLEE